MGDHGSHVDEIFKTPVGQMEVNNPAFVLVLPEKLRSNKNLMNQLNVNSKQLLTHYDLHSTLADIAQVS